MTAHYEAMRENVPKNEYAYRKAEKRLRNAGFVRGLTKDHPVAVAHSRALIRVAIMRDYYIRDVPVLDSTIEITDKAIDAYIDAVDALKRDPEQMRAGDEQARIWDEEDRLAESECLR